MVLRRAVDQPNRCWANMNTHRTHLPIPVLSLGWRIGTI